MGEALAFPKPKDAAKAPCEAFKVMPDGREICDLNTSAGRAEYKCKVERMRLRQYGICCLEGHAPMCPGGLRKEDATFEHENGRGGGKRDDREILPDGTWINGAAHAVCNAWKASRYIAYNDGRRNG